MRLVLDASVLVGELLGAAGRERLADPRLELFLAEHTWDELRHELPKRVAAFSRRHQLSPAIAEDLVRHCLAAVEANVAIVPEVAYSPLEDEARWRCARDPNDWPIAALAITLDEAFWTNDADFLGTGVATWSTATVHAWLERHAGE